MDKKTAVRAHVATLLKLPAAETLAEATDGLDEPLGDVLPGGPTPE